MLLYNIMKRDEFIEILTVLQKEYHKWHAPATKLAKHYEYNRTPYTILISALLSSRTKDETTYAAAHRLFAIADTPQKMVNVSRETIEQAIYPVGFYKQKALFILSLSHELLQNYGGKVPDSLDELVKLPGVGVKVAKIVLEKAFNRPYIAVDAHIARLCKLWGIANNAKECDKKLQEFVPDSMKIGCNQILVSFGQAICRVKKPQCQICPIKSKLESFGIECMITA